jgi:aryl-alcohol dehydrogenase-like predicted oxidoreductase
MTYNNKSNLEKIILGTVQLGLDYGINNVSGKISETEIASILEIAVKNNLLFIDTAQAYGDSETRLGNYFSTSTHSWKVVTKITKQNTERLTDSIIESCSRLNLKKLYGILYHDFLSFKEHPESFTELENLQNNGIVEKIGFSLYHPEELEFLFENKVNFNLIQIPYNVFDQRFEKHFEELHKRNISVHIRSVFLQGLIFSDIDAIHPFFEGFKPKLEKLNKISTLYDTPKDVLCMLFALQNKNISNVVMGTDNSKQFAENIETIGNYFLTDEIIQSLKELNETNINYILPYLWKIK